MPAIAELLLLPLLFLICSVHITPALAARIPSRKLVLVSTPSTVLTYHNGPLLSSPSPITLYFLWYGAFTEAQKSILRDFAASFSANAAAPSVASWWALSAAYTDKSGTHVSPSVKLASSEATLPVKPGAALTKADIENLVLNATKSKAVKVDPKGVYFVLTAEDVLVEDFCMNSCGFHDAAAADSAGTKLVYSWVGNAAKQCPGYCAWPYAKPENGPANGRAPLRAPNGDVGVDGMVINMAALLAGTATNPYNTGYYQGDALAPLEAATACTGIFGPGAFPGNPGTLATDAVSGASFNARGANSRLFLLPAIWSPASQLCTPVS